MRSKIVIAGGTGFLGKYLTGEFKALDHEVIIISRHPEHIQWDDARKITDALNGAAVLINLAGKSVNCRYSDANKKEILDSRIKTTAILGNAIGHCANPPGLWMNASTATIYRHSEDTAMTEQSVAFGSEYSCFVGKKWEETFFGFTTPGTRKVALRISIVLGKEGALPEYEKITRWGLGGSQGNGRQMVSWIHIEDFFQAVLFIWQHQEISGSINITAPTPLPNKRFMEALRKAMHKSFGLPVPVPLLKLGALLTGTETELLLKSRWVVPQELLTAGFRFKYSLVADALDNLLNSKSV